MQLFAQHNPHLFLMPLKKPILDDASPVFTAEIPKFFLQYKLYRLSSHITNQSSKED
jgi:hypothetical protein